MPFDVMRLGLLADIHSNFTALEAALEALRTLKLDGLVFLGDYVCDFPEPQKTMALLRQAQGEWPCAFIRGNRDEYIIDRRQGKQAHWQDGSHTGSLLYTYDNMPEGDIDWLASLPDTRSLEFPGIPPFTICHGSPGNAYEWLYEAGEARIRQAMLDTGHQLLVCGHSHYQETMAFEEGQVAFVGSVGCAMGEQAVADYAVLHGSKDGFEIQHGRVPYDPQPLLQAFRDSGLARRAPCWARAMGHHVLTGENTSLHLLRRVQQLAREAGENQGPLIAEGYWEQVAKEMGLMRFYP